MAFVEPRQLAKKQPMAQVRVRLAFVELLEEQGLADVSVKSICERAGVNRKTFYDYYQDKYDIYDSLVLGFLSEACACFLYEKDRPGQEGESKLTEDCSAFLRFLDDHRREMTALLDPRYHDRWAPLLGKIVEGKSSALCVRGSHRRRKLDVPASLLVDTVSSQLIIWIYWWLDQEEFALEEGAAILARLMARSMSACLRYEPAGSDLDHPGGFMRGAPKGGTG